MWIPAFDCSVPEHVQMLALKLYGKVQTLFLQVDPHGRVAGGWDWAMTSYNREGAIVWGQLLDCVGSKTELAPNVDCVALGIKQEVGYSGPLILESPFDDDPHHTHPGHPLPFRVGNKLCIDKEVVTADEVKDAVWSALYTVA